MNHKVASLIAASLSASVSSSVSSVSSAISSSVSYTGSSLSFGASLVDLASSSTLDPVAQINSIPPHDIIDISGFLPALRLTDSFSLPVYFLIVSFAFTVCLFWLVRRTEDRHLSRNTALDISLVLMMSGFVGARLFHVVFEEPAYYLASPRRILEVWAGGFVWYGGALLGTVTTLAYLRWKKLYIAQWLDVFAPLGALGYALGRVACLFTGCCYGRVSEWAGHVFRHPTQLYAIVWEACVLVVLIVVERKSDQPQLSAGLKPVGWLSRLSASFPWIRQLASLTWVKPKGQIFALWIALHSLGRIVMELFRADPRGPMPVGMSMATWISLGLLSTALVFLFRRRSS